METTLQQFKTLKPGELYAFEQFARRERARAQARLMQAGARRIVDAFKWAFSKGPTAVRVHRQVAHHAYE